MRLHAKILLVGVTAFLTFGQSFQAQAADASTIECLEMVQGKVTWKVVGRLLITLKENNGGVKTIEVNRLASDGLQAIKGTFDSSLDIHSIVRGKVRNQNICGDVCLLEVEQIIAKDQLQSGLTVMVNDQISGDESLSTIVYKIHGKPVSTADVNHKVKCTGAVMMP